MMTEQTTTTRLATRKAVAIALIALGVGFAFAFAVKPGKQSTAPSTQQPSSSNETLTSDLVPGWPKPLPDLGSSSQLAVDVTSAAGQELPLLEYVSFRQARMNVRSFDLAQQPGWPTPEIESNGSPIATWQSRTGQRYFAVGGADYLYLYGSNGQPMPGWPVRPVENCCVAPTYIAILDDLNNDDSPEVIWYRSYWDNGPWLHKIWIYDLSGNPLPGWPVTESGAPTDLLVSVGDVLPGIPGKEIVVQDSVRGLRLFTLTGAEIQTNGWPRALFPDIFPTLANVDSTGGLEVMTCEWITGSMYRVHAFRGDGTEPTGWPIDFSDGCFQQPMLANLDSDSTYELVVGAYTKIYIWQLDGTPPVTITPPFPVFNQIHLLDIDNQQGLEVVIASDHTLRAYRPNGAEVVNALWPKTLPSGVEAFIASDLRGDGTLDLLVFTNQAYLFDLPTPAIPKNQFWPFDYGTPGRTSVVDQCVDGTVFGQCAPGTPYQRCVNGELRADSSCAGGGGKQQVAP